MGWPRHERIEMLSNYRFIDHVDREIGEIERLLRREALAAAFDEEFSRCMTLFKDIIIEDTRICLLAALRRLADPDAAESFAHNFKTLEGLWEAFAPILGSTLAAIVIIGCVGFTRPFADASSERSPRM